MAIKGFEQIYDKDELAKRMFHILTTGKQEIDAQVRGLGVMMAQVIMTMEREELSEPGYFPRQRGVYKWAYRHGSIGRPFVSPPMPSEFLLLQCHAISLPLPPCPLITV